MSKPPSVADLGVTFTEMEDKVARGAINCFGTNDHPMPKDEDGIRAVNFVAGYVRDCLHTGLHLPNIVPSEGTREHAESALAKLDAVLEEPARMIEQRMPLAIYNMRVGLEVVTIHKLGGNYPGALYCIPGGAKGTITKINPSPDTDAGEHVCEVTMGEHYPDLDEWNNVLHVALADGDAVLGDFVLVQ